MGYKFYFDTIEDANIFSYRVQEIANDYGMVCLADLYDLVGQPTCWKDNKIRWYGNVIQHTTLAFPTPVTDSYCVEFPTPIDENSRNPLSTINHNQTPTPKPLNISILMDSIKDPHTTIREVIRQANEIKDRPVFITIN